MLHQLFVHLLLLLHLLAGHADLVVQRLDLGQLPGRLQLDGEQTGSAQVSACWEHQHFLLLLLVVVLVVLSTSAA